MKKLDITKEQFNRSSYFRKKYGTLKYVSESGKTFKTSKGRILKFSESLEDDDGSESEIRLVEIEKIADGDDVTLDDVNRYFSGYGYDHGIGHWMVEMVEEYMKYGGPTHWEQLTDDDIADVFLGEKFYAVRVEYGDGSYEISAVKIDDRGNVEFREECSEEFEQFVKNADFRELGVDKKGFVSIRP